MDELVSDPLATPEDDGGAATAERYRYQWVTGATWSCGLLDEGSDVESYYCEQHEDLIAQLKSGKFKALQIKTRDPRQDPFKTFDDEMMTALRKFIELEKEFGETFVQYVISTNHAFYQSKKTASNLPYLLSCAREGLTVIGLERLAKKLAKQCECEEAVVLNALAKSHCDDGLPKLVDADRCLQHTVQSVQGIGDAYTYRQIESASSALVTAVMLASAAAGEGALPIYLRTGGASPSDAIKVAAKRIDVLTVQSVVHEHLSPSPELVATPDPHAPWFPDSTLATKLTLGGLSAQAVDNARDLFYSVVHRYKEWESKFGPRRALSMNGHVKAIVRNECAMAFERSKSSGDPFGPQMLSELNAALSTRALTEDSLKSSKEHLLGVAYLLTDECVTWWSVSRGQV